MVHSQRVCCVCNEWKRVHLWAYRVCPHAFRWEIEKKDSSSSIQSVSKKKALLCSACYARQKRTKQAADKEKCVWDIGNLVYKRSKVHHVSNFEQIPVVFHVCHSRSFRARISPFTKLPLLGMFIGWIHSIRSSLCAGWLVSLHAIFLRFSFPGWEPLRWNVCEFVFFSVSDDLNILPIFVKYVTLSILRASIIHKCKWINLRHSKIAVSHSLC